LNPAGLRARPFWLVESANQFGCHQHLGGQLEFILDTSSIAVFFCGVSRARLNISISTLLFFVPSKSVNHALIDGGSLPYQVG
jgi:hypothetical protein